MTQHNKLLLKHISLGLINIFKKPSFLKLSKFFFYAFIFVIPFQIDIVFYTSSVFASGNFNPFASGFIYLAEIFFILGFIFWGASIFTGGYKGSVTYGKAVIMVFLILFFIVAEISVLFAKDQLISFFLVVRLFELLLVYFFIINDVISTKRLLWIFVLSVFIQSIIAILQYIIQGSVGLFFLGEPLISSEIPGVAKIALQDESLLRPYGTFAHPNLLSGFILVSLFFAYYLFKREKKKIFLLLLVFFIATLILTFSRSAFMAAMVGVLSYFSLSKYKFSFKYLLLTISFVIFFIVLFDLESAFLGRLLFADINSLQERVFYFSISKLMMFAIPFGVGLGNFTLNMSNFTNIKLAPWDFQPVHNIFMLIANEIGFIGLFIFVVILTLMAVFLFLRLKKSKGIYSDYGKVLFALLVCICVLGLFDHYLISIYQGQVLLFIVLALGGKYIISKSRL